MPIENQQHCYVCHGSEKRHLGVLRVGVSWEPIKQAFFAVVRKDLLVAVTFYGMLLMLAWLFQRLYDNERQSRLQLQQTQDQLIKTEKMAAIGQMAAAISHDLRNPLTGIKMATYYLGSKLRKEDDELIEIIKDIELEIDYASNVVTNILSYARPTQLVYTSVLINDLIKEALSFVHLQNRDNRITIVAKYDEQLPEIYIDEKQIKQVILNLFTNALQAMPKGGTLTICTTHDRDSLSVVVEDTGIGISEETQTKIFAPFFTTRARGVGLGLAIVHSIMEKHGGSVNVESDPSNGTRFTLRLPLREVAPEQIGLDSHAPSKVR